MKPEHRAERNHKQHYEFLTMRVERSVLKELRRIAKRDLIPLTVMLSAELARLAKKKA